MFFYALANGCFYSIMFKYMTTYFTNNEQIIYSLAWIGFINGFVKVYTGKYIICF
jgi:hypothetical protein